MVNYSGKFAPNLAEVTTPLRLLRKKDNEFIWDEAQTKAFNDVKAIITNTPVLGYFDTKKLITIECDLSMHGIGACLIQDDHPIALA